MSNIEITPKKKNDQNNKLFVLEPDDVSLVDVKSYCFFKGAVLMF